MMLWDLVLLVRRTKEALRSCTALCGHECDVMMQKGGGCIIMLECYLPTTTLEKSDPVSLIFCSLTFHHIIYQLPLQYDFGGFHSPFQLGCVVCMCIMQRWKWTNIIIKYGTCNCHIRYYTLDASWKQSTWPKHAQLLMFIKRQLPVSNTACHKMLFEAQLTSREYISKQTSTPKKQDRTSPSVQIHLLFLESSS